MVMIAGSLAPENEPEPLPSHLLKLKPLEAVAVILPLAPEFLHPLPGLTLPPIPAIMVRKY
jgi:hypothetical protein